MLGATAEAVYHFPLVIATVLRPLVQRSCVEVQR